MGSARQRVYVILGTALGLIVGGVIGYFTPRPQKASKPIVISTPFPTSTRVPTPTPSPIRVYVSGAVNDPAVYELELGSIVQDAIDAAGGPVSDADLEGINLALELKDQQQVHVPREGEASPPPVVSGGASEEEAKGAAVNINTATAVELEKLPGVGPVTAEKIVEYREENGPFESIEEIQDVPGIGEKTFEGMEGMIIVGW